jgi:hypothetical protein
MSATLVWRHFGWAVSNPEEVRWLAFSEAFIYQSCRGECSVRALLKRESSEWFQDLRGPIFHGDSGVTSPERT